jgi:hypothetical protein
MRFAYWIIKAAEAHSVLLIRIAFPRRQELGERASILRYTYTAWFVINHQHEYPGLQCRIHCATNRKVAGLIPDGVTGIFQ